MLVWLAGWSSDFLGVSWSTDDALKCSQPCHSRGMLGHYFGPTGGFGELRCEQQKYTMSKTEKWVNFLYTLVIGNLYGFRKMVVSERFGSEKFNPLWKQHKNKMDPCTTSAWFKPEQTIDVTGTTAFHRKQLRGLHPSRQLRHISLGFGQKAQVDNWEKVNGEAWGFNNLQEFFWSVFGELTLLFLCWHCIELENSGGPVIFWVIHWNSTAFLYMIILVDPSSWDPELPIRTCWGDDLSDHDRTMKPLRMLVVGDGVYFRCG